MLVVLLVDYGVVEVLGYLEYLKILVGFFSFDEIDKELVV